MSGLRFCVICFGGLCLPLVITAADGTCSGFGSDVDCADDAPLLAESRRSVLLQVSGPKVKPGHVVAIATDSEEEKIDATVACSGSGLDPWSSGSHIPCCSGLRECIRTWNGGNRWFYKCLASCSEQEPTISTIPAPAPPPTPVSAVSGTVVSLKFLEWNVYYKNRDTIGMAEIVKPNAPDIIGLDEFTASKSSMRSHLNQLVQGRNYDMQPGWTRFEGYGTYIYYDRNRFDALEGGVESVHCSGTRGGNRAANWVVLREKTTQGLLITGGIHLSYCNGGCDWVHECELSKMYDKFYSMKSRYPGARVVWMGDLNRDPNSRIVRNLLQGRIGGRRVFVVGDLAQSEHRTYYHGGTIDYIFGEGDAFFRMTGGNTGQGQPHQRLSGADHFPIFATVQWNPSAPPPQPTSTPSPPPSMQCQAQRIQRRRRISSCSCRRRNGLSSTGQYECVGNLIVMEM